MDINNAPSHGEQMGNSGQMMEDESGSSDNRIAWNPSQFPETKEWQDGQEYTITARIRQTAPGEGVITELSGQVAEAEPGEAPAAEANETMEEGEPVAQSNPAIGRAMQRRKY